MDPGSRRARLVQDRDEQNGSRIASLARRSGIYRLWAAGAVRPAGCQRPLGSKVAPGARDLIAQCRIRAQRRRCTRGQIGVVMSAPVVKVAVFVGEDLES